MLHAADQTLVHVGPEELLRQPRGNHLWYCGGPNEMAHDGAFPVSIRLGAVHAVESVQRGGVGHDEQTRGKAARVAKSQSDGTTVRRCDGRLLRSTCRLERMHTFLRPQHSKNGRPPNNTHTHTHTTHNPQLKHDGVTGSSLATGSLFSCLTAWPTPPPPTVHSELTGGCLWRAPLLSRARPTRATTATCHNNSKGQL